VPEVYWKIARSSARVSGKGHRVRCQLGQEVVALDQQLRLAVFDPQLDAVGPEQREQRHGDRACFHGAEHCRIESARRLELDGDTVAALDAFGQQPMRDAG